MNLKTKLCNNLIESGILVGGGKLLTTLTQTG